MWFLFETCDCYSIIMSFIFDNVIYMRQSLDLCSIILWLTFKTCDSFFSQSIAFDLHNPIRWSFILCHLHRRSNKNPKCRVGMSRLLNMSDTLLNKSFNKLWVVQRFKRHTCMLNKNIYIHLVWSSLFLKKIDCNS